MVILEKLSMSRNSPPTENVFDGTLSNTEWGYKFFIVELLFNYTLFAEMVIEISCSTFGFSLIRQCDISYLRIMWRKRQMKTFLLVTGMRYFGTLV